MNAKEIELSERSFEESLNERFGDVDVCGTSYPAGTVLRTADPTAFRVAMADEELQYACGECNAEYEGVDAEEEAEECCTETCPECGEIVGLEVTECPDCETKI